MPPLRLPNGDFVLYHGTSPEGAESIVRRRELHSDDLAVIGVGTTPEAVKVFGTMKAKDKGKVLEVVVSQKTMDGVLAGHEIGGSGFNQFLLSQRSPDRLREAWSLPVESVRVVPRD